MIRVSIYFVGIFKKYHMDSPLEISFIEGCCLIDVLNDLADVITEPQIFKEEVVNTILSDVNLQKLIFVNQRNVFYNQLMDKPLEDGDKIMFLPPMEGG